MTVTQLALSLSTLALLLSIVALFAVSRISDRSLLKRLNAHSERLSDLEAAQEANHTRIKSIRAQVGAVTTSRKANNEVPELTSGTTEAEKDRWQREANLAIARDKFRNPLAR
jgi:hypothetical protein